MFVQSAENRQTAIGLIEPGWAYEMRLERQNGRWIVAELRLFPDSWNLEFKRLARRTKYNMSFATADEAARSARSLAHFVLTQPRPEQPTPVPAGGLTTRHLRKVPFGRSSGTAALTSLDAIAIKLASVYRRREDLRKQEKALERTLKFLGRGDGRLAQIASCYVKVLGGGSQRQNVDVARQLNMKVSQVRDAICLARRKGLLTATHKQGIPGGALTPKAIELLKGLNTIAQTSRTPTHSRRKNASTQLA